MTAKITLDRAGRVLLPKLFRERMRLGAGDMLILESDGEQITLRPIRAKAALRKEYGVWVYQGEPVDVEIKDLIDRERDRRMRVQMLKAYPPRGGQASIE